jgi:hypothetical protein
MMASGCGGSRLGGGATAVSLPDPPPSAIGGGGAGGAIGLVSAADARLNATNPITTEASKPCFTAIFSVDFPRVRNAAVGGARMKRKDEPHSSNVEKCREHFADSQSPRLAGGRIAPGLPGAIWAIIGPAWE